MNKNQFDSNVENIYISLSAEDKEIYKANENRFNKNFLIGGIICVILTLAAVGGTIFCIIENEYVLSIFAGIIMLLGVLSDVWIIKSSVTGLKADDEIKIKKQIERIEKQRDLANRATEKRLLEDLQKNVYYRLSVDNIKMVTILDSYTEVSTKLHAVLNYQEIIQTRVYKFKVDYNNGTSEIVTSAEGSEEYSVLMPRVKSTTEINAEPINNIEKLMEFKQLLDDGIITQEEYEAKKKEILTK